jgi:multicomponent Na+:H+ antiporter subunit G
MTTNATGADPVIDAVTAVLLIVGALMSLGAAIGLLRFPDLMSRMHAATKPQVLGLFLVLAAIGLQLREWWVWPVLAVAWIFQLLTVPVSAHMVGRAGYRTKHRHPERLSADELEAVVLRAAGERAAEKDAEAADSATPRTRNAGNAGGHARNGGPSA